MDYRHMEISTLNKQPLGYLSSNGDWTTQKATIQKTKEHARDYKFEDRPGGKKRLYQKTAGGDRSFTYSSNGMYPCWGLGVNYVDLTYGDDYSLTFNSADGTLYYVSEPTSNDGVLNLSKTPDRMVLFNFADIA
jgi:hypothetical protein